MSRFAQTFLDYGSQNRLKMFTLRPEAFKGLRRGRTALKSSKTFSAKAGYNTWVSNPAKPGTFRFTRRCIDRNLFSLTTWFRGFPEKVISSTEKTSAAS